jgi:hypothetical protein
MAAIGKAVRASIPVFAMIVLARCELRPPPCDRRAGYRRGSFAMLMRDTLATAPDLGKCREHAMDDAKAPSRPGVARLK